MSSIKDNYYIYILHRQPNIYAVAHLDKLVRSTDDDDDKIIYMFNVHSRQIAKLATYLFSEKPNEKDKRKASDLCKKMQDCIYKAQHIIHYISTDSRLSDLRKTLSYNSSLLEN